MYRSIHVHPHGPARMGITLTETLVSISIFALLLAILVPAIQSARASSRRIQCSNNQKQLLLALSLYAETYTTLPLLAVSGGGSQCPETAITRLFPYLEIPPICEIGRDVSRFQVLECPADAETSQVARPLSYSFNASPGQNAGSRDHGPFDQLATVRMGDIIDGVSTTAAISENIVSLAGGSDSVALKTPVRYTWSVFVPPVSSASLTNPLSQSALAERASQTELSILDCLQGPRTFTPISTAALGQWNGGFGGGSWTYSHWYPPNTPTCAVQGGGLDSPFVLSSRRAGSGHSGGVNVGFIDGHVSFISDQIDKSIWRAIGTRDGNETVGDY